MNAIQVNCTASIYDDAAAHDDDDAADVDDDGGIYYIYTLYVFRLMVQSTWHR